MAASYAYYPGCSLHSSGIEYDISFRAVCKVLGIELNEVQGWVCCGTSCAHASSTLLSLALPMKNLALVEKMGFEHVVAPCASCLARFKTALYETRKHPELHDQLAELIEAPLPLSVKALHPLEILGDDARLKDAQKRQLSSLNVACYYGCLLTRPPKIMQFDEPEYPMSMDNLLRSLGFTTLDWSYKTDCCGGALALTETDVVLRLTHDILEEAKAVGANAVAVACSLCHANLDTRQEEIEQVYQVQYGIPVFYFTQLMGLAFGIRAEDLGIDRHFVEAEVITEALAGSPAA